MNKNIVSLFIAGCFCFSAYAQVNITYQLPPKSIVELADATVPTAAFSNDGNFMLLLQTPGFETIEQVAQPVIGIAGLKFNPANSSLEQEFSGAFSGISLKDIKTNAVYAISGLPEKMAATHISWSPDNSYFAFTNKTISAVELWLADVKNHTARKVFEKKLNDAFGNTFQWHPDGKHLLVQAIPDGRGAVPQQSLVPSGPVVQENLGVKTPSRTYQYLLKNQYDETLMDYFLTSQLELVDLEGRSVAVGRPAIYKEVAYSPDGKYLMVQTVEKPYSYLVPIELFPYQTSILDSEGNMVKSLFKAPLADNIPISFDAVAAGPRSYEWRADAPATLVWVEAQDHGNPAEKTDTHDALFALSAPFTEAPKKLFSMVLRYGGVTWGNSSYAIIKENWRKDRKTKVTLFNPETGTVVKEIVNGSSEQTYSDPGRFVYEKGGDGGKLLLFDKAKNPVVFTIGAGASPQGDRPFLMRWDLVSGKQDTLFKSKAPYYEAPVFFNNKGVVYISRESVDDPPNFFAINLKNKKEAALSAYPNPYPGLKGVQRSLLSYKRKDGLPLSATLYLPAGYKKEDGPLPVLIWAYPREFKSAAAAGQVKGSPYRFPKLAFRSPVFWVTRGYAILDDADMPVVGEGSKEPNDTFLEQIEDNANALINYVVDMGVADRKRIGVGGHSYGAFMTVNLLAHTDLFAAGIARSGAYNRTLTPFSFQGESRTYWQAPDVYNKMAPFNYADKIKTPLLLTHGIDDDNSGTFPIQSERLYSAVKGFGGTVRLVMLPKEFHGYRSRESVLHTFWEQDQWLEKYVKNRK